MQKKVHDFTVVIEQDEEGWYVATVPEIEGCATQGKTIPELLERVKEAIEACVESDKDSVKKNKFVGVQKVEVAV